ncbi:NLI interacting factor-like phosphatase, putative [Plasmodium gallinaceum]|uniref:NLI interacting factor-like phosphatase, putative n=1 Tax=Plasmodium gallinaceum TaxID=5849 RepID=A0A1J1GXZ9_PLAGA|nr:NLI interacting factor-like phosphatase, putative [Plasmodium gallinaceum]CRG97436.1 NLI interacting factor-like phosphatase, putative [Plasmodium gallinaceum]
MKNYKSKYKNKRGNNVLKLKDNIYIEGLEYNIISPYFILNDNSLRKDRNSNDIYCTLKKKSVKENIKIPKNIKKKKKDLKEKLGNDSNSTSDNSIKNNLIYFNYPLKCDNKCEKDTIKGINCNSNDNKRNKILFKLLINKFEHKKKKNISVLFNKKYNKSIKNENEKPNLRKTTFVGLLRNSSKRILNSAEKVKIFKNFFFKIKKKHNNLNENQNFVETNQKKIIYSSLNKDTIYSKKKEGIKNEKKKKINSSMLINSSLSIDTQLNTQDENKNRNKNNQIVSKNHKIKNYEWNIKSYNIKKEKKELNQSSTYYNKRDTLKIKEKKYKFTNKNIFSFNNKVLKDRKYLGILNEGEDYIRMNDFIFLNSFKGRSLTPKRIKKLNKKKTNNYNTSDIEEVKNDKVNSKDSVIEYGSLNPIIKNNCSNKIMLTEETKMNNKDKKKNFYNVKNNIKDKNMNYNNINKKFLKINEKNKIVMKYERILTKEKNINQIENISKICKENFFKDVVTNKKKNEDDKEKEKNSEEVNNNIEKYENKNENGKKKDRNSKEENNNENNNENKDENNNENNNENKDDEYNENNGKKDQANKENKNDEKNNKENSEKGDNNKKKKENDNEEKKNNSRENSENDEKKKEDSEKDNEDNKSESEDNENENDDDNEKTKNNKNEIKNIKKDATITKDDNNNLLNKMYCEFNSDLVHEKKIKKINKKIEGVLNYNHDKYKKKDKKKIKMRKNYFGFMKNNNFPNNIDNKNNEEKIIKKKFFFNEKSRSKIRNFIYRTEIFSLSKKDNNNMNNKKKLKNKGMHIDKKKDLVKSTSILNYMNSNDSFKSNENSKKYIECCTDSSNIDLNKNHVKSISREEFTNSSDVKSKNEEERRNIEKRNLKKKKNGFSIDKKKIKINEGITNEKENRELDYNKNEKHNENILKHINESIKDGKHLTKITNSLEDDKNNLDNTKKLDVLSNLRQTNNLLYQKNMNSVCNSNRLNNINDENTDSNYPSYIKNKINIKNLITNITQENLYENYYMRKKKKIEKKMDKIKIKKKKFHSYFKKFRSFLFFENRKNSNNFSHNNDGKLNTKIRKKKFHIKKKKKIKKLKRLSLLNIYDTKMLSNKNQDESLLNINYENYNSNKYLLGKQKEKDKGKKTIVLDLDETLVHSSLKKEKENSFKVDIDLDDGQYFIYVNKRPGVDDFFKEISKYYEVVIFTASLSTYANAVIDKIDVDHVCSYRLFRESCSCWKNNYVKDIKKLGRDLNNVIIIDNSIYVQKFCEDNCILIESWFDDPNDQELYKLIPFLKKLSKKTSVISELKKYNKKKKK